MLELVAGALSMAHSGCSTPSRLTTPAFAPVQGDGSVHLYTLARCIAETNDLSCRPRLDAIAETLRELGYRQAERGKIQAWLPPGRVSKVGRPRDHTARRQETLLLPPNSVSQRSSPEIVVKRIEGQTTVARSGREPPSRLANALARPLPEVKRRSIIATLEALYTIANPHKRRKAFMELVRAIHDHYGEAWLDDGFVALFNAMLERTRASARPPPHGLPSRWRALVSGPDSVGRVRRELYAWPRQRAADFRGPDDGGAVVPFRELLHSM